MNNPRRRSWDRGRPARPSRRDAKNEGAGRPRSQGGASVAAVGDRGHSRHAEVIA